MRLEKMVRLPVDVGRSAGIPKHLQHCAAVLVVELRTALVEKLLQEFYRG